jgi:nucleotidyltransferase/DNA polymerase involved in DNA repair
MVKQRVIALVDCDSFFVSCEQKRDVSLKGKPVCVISNKEGCVISRSREAKKMGIRMGEPLFMAKKEHPAGMYIVADHNYYGYVSSQVMRVLKEFSPYVQIYSVDEAFVDFTGLKRLYKKNYAKLAIMLRQRVLDEVDIPVSVGVSSTKTLAKLASDKAKNSPNGIYLIGKRKILKEIKKTDIDEIWGIGRRLTKRLRQLGVLNTEELVTKQDEWLDKQIGIHGIEMKHELLGEMVSPVVNAERVPKSIQNSRAFGIFTSDFNYIKSELNRHIHTSCSKLRSYGTKCMQIGVMLRTKDFRVFYTKKDLLYPVDFELEISEIAISLLKDIFQPDVLYRAVGVTLERIGEQGAEQLSLYSDNEISDKKEKLAKCFDRLEAKFGKNIVKTGFYRQKH